MASVPTTTTVLSRDATNAGELINSFILYGSVVTINTITRITRRFRVFIRIVSVIRRQIKRVFSNSKIAPSTRYGPNVPDFLQTRTGPNNFGEYRDREGHSFLAGHWGLAVLRGRGNATADN